MFDRRSVFAAACLGMLVFGVVLTSLGALLPSLTARFGIDKAGGGSLLMLMSVGILLGSLVFGPAADRYGYKGLLLLSLALVLVGLEGIAFASSLGALRLSILAVGVGGGVINGGTNALVADISTEGRTAGLSLLGIYFGIGAVGVPFALGSLLDDFSYRALGAAIGLVAVLPLVLTAAIRFPLPKQARGVPVRRAARLASDPVLLLLGAMLFLESGMEITVGGWTATYVQEQMGLAGPRALYFLSLYWFGMMLARLALGTALARASGTRVLPCSIGVALLGSLLLVTAPGLTMAGVGIFLTGAGLAAAFPVVLGLVGARWAELSGTAFSIALTMALVGGSVIPYATGVLGGLYGLRASLLVVPVALVLQLALFAAVLRRAAASRPAAAVPAAGD
jgi:fucose permease